MADEAARLVERLSGRELEALEAGDAPHDREARSHRAASRPRARPPAPAAPRLRAGACARAFPRPSTPRSDGPATPRARRARHGEQLGVGEAERRGLGVVGPRRVEPDRLAVPGRGVDDGLAVGAKRADHTVPWAKVRRVKVGSSAVRVPLPARRPSTKTSPSAASTRAAARATRRGPRARTGAAVSRAASAPLRSLPASCVSRSNATSRADWKRSSGRFSRQWRTRPFERGSCGRGAALKLGRILLQDGGHRLGGGLAGERALAASASRRARHRARGGRSGDRRRVRAPARATCSPLCPRSSPGRSFGERGGSWVSLPLAADADQRARPKSRIFTRPSRGQEHVLGLEVAVNDALLVRGGEAVRDLGGDLERLARRQRARRAAARGASLPPAAPSPRTAAAVASEIVDRQDVRVRRARLWPWPRARSGRGHRSSPRCASAAP